MKIPSILLKSLLKIHKRAELTPYFHLHGYMLRDWILGARSPERNHDNPNFTHPMCAHKTPGFLYRWLCKNFCIRAHTILKSDSDRALHDHPCASISIVLSGGYWEIEEPTDLAIEFPLVYQFMLERLGKDSDCILSSCTLFGIHWRGPGAVIFRRASKTHRLVLPIGVTTKSIFCFFKKTQSWGFYVEGKKIGWREYLGEKE